MSEISFETVSPPFRVVVVGGGVTGLTASHVLSKAGIDHVVLERGLEAAPPSGASIAIYPHGARILEQLGCLDELLKITTPMDRLVNRRPDGTVVMERDFWTQINQNHGYNLMFFERRGFLQCLHDQLPDKSRLLLGKKVTRIEETYEGAEVFLADGTSEKGDIVIGCDGVHSLVRQAMWDNADKLSPGLITVKERMTMMTTWTCLLGMASAVPGMGNELSAVHNERYSFLIGSQEDRTFFFVFRRVTKPYSRYTRPRWTAEDADQAAAAVADHPITENLVFADLWRRRYRAQMVDIEEGVQSHWFFGRTVLVGDAAHKITPNIALGGNSGIESIVLLTNLLHRSLATNPAIKPSRATLRSILQQYQDVRIPRMKKIMKFSNMITRVQAWDGGLMKFVALWVLPYQMKETLAAGVGDILKGAEKLDFVPLKKRPSRIRWDDDVLVSTMTTKSQKDLRAWIVGIFFVLLSALWAVIHRSF